MMPDPRAPGSKSSTGLNEELAAALTYVVGPFTGIFFLCVERQSDFVRFHARQCIAVFVLAALAHFALSDLPLLGTTAARLFTVGLGALWLVLMFKALGGEKYKLPYIGEWVEGR